MTYTVEAYRTILRIHLLSVLRPGPQEICNLIKASNGAFPTDVIEALDSLIALKDITKHKTVYEVTRNARTESIPQIGLTSSEPLLGSTDPVLEAELAQLKSFLAEPHPLDYDWRFTANAIQSLLNLLGKDIRENGRIALLGTPSLHFFLTRRRAHTTLFDRSNSLLDDLRKAGVSEGLVECDLLDPFDSGYPKFDIAVADPPWYPEHYESFINRAAELLREGGSLILSVLPWLTRPSAINDRFALISSARQSGFTLLQAVPGFFSYETPIYEEITLRNRGIECGNWRKGDLFLFHFLGAAQQARAALPPKREEPWDEFLVGHLKIKLRRDSHPGTRHFSCTPIYGESSVLDSVSRRDPLRGSIDLWTSRNDAYRVEGAAILRKALITLALDEPPQGIARELAGEYQLTNNEEQSLVDILIRLVESSKKT